jgi:hypothetical protein
VIRNGLFFIALISFAAGLGGFFIHVSTRQDNALAVGIGAGAVTAAALLGILGLARWDKW